MSLGLVKRVTLLSGARVAAATVLSEWVDCDEYNELLAWLDVTAFAARDDETLVVTIERQADNTAGYVTIATFTTINGTGTASEEEGVTSQLGGKIRVRAVLAGTWSSKSITFTVKVMLKSA
jgi:hypothetical protein